MGNIAGKDGVPSASSGMHQILPFKLSSKHEGGTGSSSSSAGMGGIGGHSNSMKRVGGGGGGSSTASSSPRAGYQRMTEAPSHHQHSKHDSPPDAISHQRTGSSPAQMPMPPGAIPSAAAAGPRVVNTLPKSGEGNPADEKVIYF